MNRLSTSSQSPFLTYHYDGVTVSYRGQAAHDRDVGFAVAAQPLRPVDQLVAYFEVTVVAATTCAVSIGVVPRKGVECVAHPTDDDAMFYRGGRKYAGDTLSEEYGEAFGAGDTIGCGFSIHRNQLFFTKNGEYLGPAFDGVPARLFPAASVHNAGESIRFAFRPPFKFDVAAMEQAEKDRLAAVVSNQSVAPGAVWALVRDHLLHGGYKDTLACFSRSRGRLPGSPVPSAAATGAHGSNGGPPPTAGNSGTPGRHGVDGSVDDDGSDGDDNDNDDGDGGDIDAAGNGAAASDSPQSPPSTLSWWQPGALSAFRAALAPHTVPVVSPPPVANGFIAARSPLVAPQRPPTDADDGFRIDGEAGVDGHDGVTADDAPSLFEDDVFDAADSKVDGVDRDTKTAENGDEDDDVVGPDPPPSPLRLPREVAYTLVAPADATDVKRATLGFRHYMRRLIMTGQTSAAVSALRHRAATLFLPPRVASDGNDSHLCHLRLAHQLVVDAVAQGGSRAAFQLAQRHLVPFTATHRTHPWLQEAMGLLAYPAPGDSPLVHLLTPANRDLTATVVNDAVLDYAMRLKAEDVALQVQHHQEVGDLQEWLVATHRLPDPSLHSARHRCSHRNSGSAGAGAGTGAGAGAGAGVAPDDGTRRRGLFAAESLTSLLGSLSSLHRLFSSVGSRRRAAPSAPAVRWRHDRAPGRDSDSGGGMPPLPASPTSTPPPPAAGSGRQQAPPSPSPNARRTAALARAFGLLVRRRAPAAASVPATSAGAAPTTVPASTPPPPPTALPPASPLSVPVPAPTPPADVSPLGAAAGDDQAHGAEDDDGEGSPAALPALPASPFAVRQPVSDLELLARQLMVVQTVLHRSAALPGAPPPLPDVHGAATT